MCSMLENEYMLVNARRFEMAEYATEYSAGKEV